MTRRIVLGKDAFGGGTVGLWVSKAGVDAGANGSPDDFLVHPAKVNLQPVMSGVILSLPFLSATGPVRYSDNVYRYNNTYSISLPHGLNHVPLFFGSGQNSVRISADLANIIISANQTVAANPNTATGANNTAPLTLDFPYGYFVIRVFG